MFHFGKNPCNCLQQEKCLEGALLSYIKQIKTNAVLAFNFNIFLRAHDLIICRGEIFK